MVSKALHEVGDLVEITFTRRGAFQAIVMKHLDCVDWAGNTTTWVNYLFRDGAKVHEINLPSWANGVTLLQAGYAFAEDLADDLQQAA